MFNKLCMAMMNEVRATTEKCKRWWNHLRHTHPPSQRNTSQSWSISRKTRIVDLHHETTNISCPKTYRQVRPNETSWQARWRGRARTVSCMWGATMGAHLVLRPKPPLTISYICRRSRDNTTTTTTHIMHTTDTKPMPVKKMGGENTGANI